jgi:flagella basal body P-ring formation protein FlgA
VKRIACFAALALCAAAASAARLTMDLPEHAETAGGPVVLGQLARLSSDDLGLLRGLVDLPVGRAAPAPGRHVLFTRDELQRLVRRRAHLDAAEIAWRGADQVELAVPAATVSGRAIAEAAASAVRAWLTAQGEKGEPQWQQVPSDVDIPAGPFDLVPRALPTGAPGPRLVVWVDVLAGGRFVRLVPVVFALEPRHGRKPMHTAAGPIAEPPGFARGRAPSRQPPVVERGHWAVLRAGMGEVLAESRVEVLQDGRAGERVRVRPPGAAMPLLATVVGPGLLEVLR